VSFVYEYVYNNIFSTGYLKHRLFQYWVSLVDIREVSAVNLSKNFYGNSELYKRIRNVLKFPVSLQQRHSRRECAKNCRLVVERLGCCLKHQVALSHRNNQHIFISLLYQKYQP